MSEAQAKRVAVYCGSSSGKDPAYLAEAQALGAALARAGVGLVYGGARIGLMGAVADAVLAGGQEVIGVLPQVLVEYEIEHPGLTRLEFVETMHQRKARMAELADGFVVLPGGFGTLEELLEVVTWAQLQIHAKPCILVNTAGFWTGFLEFLDSTVEAGFLRPANRALLQLAANAEEAVAMAVRQMASGSAGTPLLESKLTPALTLRTATATDVAELLPLINEAFRIEEFFNDLRTSETALHESMRKGTILVGVDGAGRIQGSIYVEPRGNSGYLGMLAVARSSQRKGVGRWMVAQAEEWFRQKGFRETQLTILHQRTELLTIYQGMGYEPCGTEAFDSGRDLKPGVELHSIVMRKRL